MSSMCPDIIDLSALAAGDASSELEPARAHAAACKQCRVQLDLLRAEQAALSAAVLVAPPADSLARTLVAIDEASARETERPTRSRPRARTSSTPSNPVARSVLRNWLPFFLLGGAGFLFLGYAFVSTHRTPETEPPAELPAPPPAKVEKKPSPSRELAPPPPSEKIDAPREAPRQDLPLAPPEGSNLTERPRKAENPVEAPQSPERPTVPPEEPPTVVEKPDQGKPSVPEPEPKIPESPSAVAKVALATVRIGKLATSGGQSLGPGQAIVEGDVVDVGASPVVIESEQAASFVLAAKSRFALRAGAKGELTLTLSSGTALARPLGEKPYVVASADARAVPDGTFLLNVSSGKTRISALEGKVRVEVERAGGPCEVDVRAGFEALVQKGKELEAPLPLAAAKALAWVPEAQQPKKLPPSVRVLSSMGFDGTASGVKRGALVRGGAHGSKGCLKGAPGPESSTGVELDLESEEVALASQLSIEVTLKVDRRTKVEIVLEDDKGKTVRFVHELEAGRWTTLAVPLHAFGQPGQRNGKKGDERSPRGPQADRTIQSITISAPRAAEAVELLVDDLRILSVDE